MDKIMVFKITQDVCASDPCNKDNDINNNPLKHDIEKLNGHLYTLLLDK